MGTPRVLRPVDQIRNVQRTASCGDTTARDCTREKEDCRADEKRSGEIAITVARQAAFSSDLETLFANGCETGVFFFCDVAQQALLAQQPGLHAWAIAASEMMQVRAET